MVETTGIRPCRNEIEYRVRVHGGDVPDQPDVGLLPLDRNSASSSGEQVRIFTGDTDRVRTVRVDQADEFTADLTEKHHPHDVHHLGRRDPETTAELTLHAKACQHRVDLRATAVHDDGMDADSPQERHVGGKCRFERLVDHGVSAVLDHDHLVSESLQPRQRVGEDMRLLMLADHGIRLGHDEYAEFSST